MGGYRVSGGTVMRGIGALLCALLGLLCGSAPVYALPSSPADWSALFKSMPMSGDGMVSVRLDNNRVAFLTGDSIPRAGGQWAHSTITVVNGSSASMAQPGYAGLNSYQVIPETGEAYHWLGPAVAPGNYRLYVLAPKVKSIPEWPGFASIGVDVAVFTYSSTTAPTFKKFLDSPKVGSNPIEWSAGMVYRGGYLYAFGVSKNATDGWTGRDAYVSRISINTMSYSGWTYFNGSAWSTDPSKAKPILRSATDGGVENSFSATWTGTAWKLVSRYGGRWGPGKVTEWSTPVLGQPWSQTTLATVANDDPKTPDDEGAYLAWKHYALGPISGHYLLTYNQPGEDATWLSVN